MQLTLGRIVHYKLSEYDVKQIDAQLPINRGRQVRNPVQAGQVLPAMAVAVFSANAVNLKIFLDGEDTWWATSRGQGDQPGQWSWPPRA